MSVTFRTESIVIRKEPWGEKDRLYTLFTSRAGKLRVVAKGSRKFQSKMAAHLEPFLLVDVMIARGRQMDKLAGSEQVSFFPSIEKDLAKLSLLSYCFEIVDKLTSLGQADEKIFNLSRDLLDIVGKEDLPEDRGLLLAKIFTLRLLIYLGYEPELLKCLECRKNVFEKKMYFNPWRGGVLCNSCASIPRNQAFGQIETTPTVMKMLKSVRSGDLANSIDVMPTADLLKNFSAIIDEFLKYHLDGELKSEGYFCGIFTRPVVA